MACGNPDRVDLLATDSRLVAFSAVIAPCFRATGGDVVCTQTVNAQLVTLDECVTTVYVRQHRGLEHRVFNIRAVSAALCTVVLLPFQWCVFCPCCEDCHWCWRDKAWSVAADRLTGFQDVSLCLECRSQVINLSGCSAMLPSDGGRQQRRQFLQDNWD